MEKNEVISVLNTLDNEFDSHDFIREFLHYFPASYGQMLIKYEDVKKVNSQIAIYLSSHSAELGIQNVGKVVSITFFNKPDECAKWEKKQ